jgi:hypothetical protein
MWEGYLTSIPLLTYLWPRRQHDDDSRSPYRRCRHCTTIILNHQQIFEHNVPPSPGTSNAKKSGTADVSRAHNCTTASGRLFITDMTSKRLSQQHGFASLRVPSQAHPTAQYYDLCAAIGTTIPTYGWLPLSLNLGLRQDHTQRFHHRLHLPELRVTVVASRK